MVICENCGDADLMWPNDKDYSSMNRLEKIDAIKSQIKVLESERRMYVDSRDFDSVSVTNRNISALRVYLTDLENGDDY